MNDKNKKNPTTGYLCVLMAGILWGTIGLFVRFLNELGADSSVTAFIRIFVGSLIMFVVLIVMSLVKGENMFRLTKAGLIQCIILGFFTQAMFNACYSRSINSVGVATGSVLLYTAPIFVCIMSALIFKEKITMRKAIALIINLLGCFIMATGGDLSNLKVSALGIFFGVAAGFLYALVTIVGKFASGTTHPFTTTFYSFFFGWLALGVFTRPWTAIAEVSSGSFWLLALGFGLIPTVGSYLFYMSGLNHDIELSRAPIIASVEPVVATLIGVFIFSENIGLINIIGLVLVLFSVVFMNVGLKKDDPE